MPTHRILARQRFVVHYRRAIQESFYSVREFEMDYGRSRQRWSCNTQCRHANCIPDSLHFLRHLWRVLKVVTVKPKSYQDGPWMLTTTCCLYAINNAARVYCVNDTSPTHAAGEGIVKASKGPPSTKTHNTCLKFIWLSIL